MPQAQVVASFTENGYACLAVRVGVREVIGRVAMDDAWDALTAAQKKAALVDAARAVYQASLPPSPVDLGITGSVTL